MRWPDDELPWASFAGGQRRWSGQPSDPADPQRCVRTLTHAGLFVGEARSDARAGAVGSLASASWR